MHHPEQRLLLFACTATKRAEPHPIPAIERYDGPSFRTLRKWQAANPAAAAHLDVLILSAKLGLIAADALIGDYNQRMTHAGAAELREAVDAALTHTLAQRGPYAATLLHLGRDYLPAIGQAMLQAPACGFVTFTTGGIGVRLSQIKAWLYGTMNTTAGCYLREAPITVQCTGCGQTWPRDPILEVPCPSCYARMGRRCMRSSGHQAAEYHTARDLLVIERIPGYGHCPAAHPPAAVAPSLRTASQLALQF